MNNSLTHPRLICRLVRRWEMTTGPASRQTALTARHMERCEACQEFFADDAAFGESLRRDAVHMKVEPEAGIELRILQAVMETRPKTRRVISRSWGFSLLGAAAGVALALVVLQRPTSTQTDGLGVATTNKVPENPDTTVATATSSSASSEWWATLDARQSALALAKQKNPLQEEIDSVYTDAQAVIGFLAMNFLPAEAGDHSTNPASKAISGGQG